MATTHHDVNKTGLDWYVKWISTILLLLSVVFRAAGPEYREFDIILGLLACFGWLWVSILWKDRALILLNAVMGCLLASAMFDFLV